MAKKTNQEKRMTILLLNMLMVFILAALTVFVIDGWILHPISVPDDDPSFDVILAQTEYAKAAIVDIPLFEQLSRELILVEQDGKLHLLSFSRHRMSGRFTMNSDVTIEPNYSGVVRVGPKLRQGSVFLENGRIVNRSGGVEYAQNPHYFAIAMLFTAAESALLWLFLKKKYPG